MAALECASERLIIPRAKCLPLGMWIVLSYPAASSRLAVKTYLSFRAQLKSFFLLDAFPALSSRRGVLLLYFWEGFVLSYHFPALQEFHGMPELRFAYFSPVSEE